MQTIIVEQNNLTGVLQVGGHGWSRLSAGCVRARHNAELVSRAAGLRGEVTEREREKDRGRERVREVEGEKARE